MSVRLELRNSEVVARKLIDLAVETLNSAANSHEVISKALAAVDTGEMRDKTQQVVFATPSSLMSVVEAGANHSIYVEYGTVNMDAQPFFTPGFESSKRQLMNVRGIF